MTGMPEGYTFTIADPRDFTDAQIADGVALANLLQAETFPEEAPTPVEVAIAGNRSMPARYGAWNVRCRAADGTLVAGFGMGKDWDHDDNPDIGGLGASVHPDHRRRGIATAVFAYRVAFARALGQTRFFAGTNDRRPEGELIAASLGAEIKSRMHVNHLVLADVDRPLLERWVDEAASRAKGYELLTLDGPIPDDLVDAFVDLVLVMNTAPRDDLEINDFHMTVAELREGEERGAAVGSEPWTLVARHVDTGELVGFHDVQWGPWDPKIVNVGGTGVLPSHRGAALGKWLKAVMTLRVLDERPDVTEIRTGNADSNDAMLGINHAMGYKPWFASATWEVPVTTVEAWLEARGVTIPDVQLLVDQQRATRDPALAATAE